MAEAVTDYLRKQYNELIQSVLALYVAIVATLERWFPRTATSKSSTASPVASTGATMTQGHYVMPFWLWVGILALVLSVLIPAVLKMFRKRMDRKDSDICSAERDQAIDKVLELTLEVEDLRKANVHSDPCEGIFTPLQIEAF